MTAKLDFMGRPIVRPVCSHCQQEMKWQGDPCNGALGYYCRTAGCDHDGQHESATLEPKAVAS